MLFYNYLSSVINVYSLLLWFAYALAVQVIPSIGFGLGVEVADAGSAIVVPDG